MTSLTIEKIYAAYETTENDVKETVQKIKEWLTDQPHLPQTIDEMLLKHFALCDKGFVECTRRIDSYFSIRQYMPRFFASRDPQSEEFRPLNECLAGGFMPGLTPELYKVAVVKLVDIDPEKFSYVKAIAWNLMMLDVQARKELCAGFCGICDCRGITVKHYTKLSPTAARDSIFYVQNIYPLKIKHVFFVNIPNYLKVFINGVIMPCLSAKVAKRVHLYSDYPESLQEFIPKNMLPLEMGGTGISIKEINDTWIKEIISNREWLTTEGSVLTDESKRTGKCPVSAPNYCVVM